MTERGTFWTFDLVQERLIEAYGFLGRLPDRERGWLRTSISSLYRQGNPMDGLTDMERRQMLHEREADAPTMPGLTRDEVDRMEQTLRWLAWVKAGEPRRIVGIAIAQLATGRTTRVAWGSLVSDPTLPGAADRMRKAYGAAITAICARLNAAENCT